MKQRSVLRTLLATAFATTTILATGSASAITATVQGVAVTKSGSPIFVDSFDDGIAPPSSPNFISAIPHTYHIGNATFPIGSEAGGVLNANSAFGHPGMLADGTPSLSQRATIMTDGNAGNATLGLKPGATFSVSALVDITGAGGLGSFGVRFADRVVNPLDNTSTVAEMVSVEFVPDNGIIRLRRQDFVTQQIFDISSIVIPVAADQVRLFLTHSIENDPRVFGSAQFFDDG